ncbi:spondin domain-containing protein [Vicingaceae bacterium]|nr:spondin domain-containing protein [Vicingaceae bacterium]
MKFMTGGLAALLILTASIANAQQVRVTVENLQPGDGYYLTPLWVGFHDGSFDFFDVNTTSSASLEALAEGGDASGISGDFAAASTGTDAVITSPGGFAGAPVIDPGEVASAIIDVNAGMTNQYFSYASMIIPSNDGFIGNDIANAIQVFDSNGDFNGPILIELFGANVWDAGTEENDGLGAAFSATPGTDTTESLLVRIHPGLNDTFLGTDTVAGTTIGASLDAATPLATISITAVPEPTSIGLLGISALLGIAFIRRRRPAAN